MQHSNDQSFDEMKTASVVSVDNAHAEVESAVRGDDHMPQASEGVSVDNRDIPNSAPVHARLSTWGDECVPWSHCRGRNLPRPIGSERLKKRPRAIAQRHTHVRSPWEDPCIQAGVHCSSPNQIKPPWDDPYVPWGHYGGLKPYRTIASKMLELHGVRTHCDWEEHTNQVR
ncbi:uncharacterized protein TRAVEDRAFT_49598 [Trametes versicolor FP-101664 SS1]|uniref:uncharacterized protein n=1 Tax=Trametes versicolor (strain FP-101664) TaxID=717944 RepID=UPI00046239B6|nr:uncharacterized protein TRAVEDRAFT_49598 [Trametes versicolor FP-101664 SS1]EIW56778.1 hypothetical protein TRAVEDRAFT_49598 [Trametes versicolor FP-101664 SS1]